MTRETKTIIAIKSAPRLDKFLTEQLQATFSFSRAEVQKMISKGMVSINGEVVTLQKAPVNVNDQIVVEIAPLVEQQINAEAIDFEVLHEDDDLLVVNKPNNLVVHPGAGNQSGTLVNGLVHKLESLREVGSAERPGIVHRLDKQTTGLLIVAKNNKTHKKLSTMFAHHQVVKQYQVLVWGVVEENAGLIEAPIGRHENDRQKMTVTKKNAKEARTQFRVLERFANATLVECTLETGRTHQIRVHFKFINHPVINDPTYGRLSEKATAFGQYLHAYRLAFKHPSTNEEMEFIAPLPAEFNDKIKTLREDK